MIRSFLRSGIFHVYITVTVVSAVALAHATGDVLAAVAVSGWLGFFAAIIANTITPGFTIYD